GRRAGRAGRTAGECNRGTIGIEGQGRWSGVVPYFASSAYGFGGAGGVCAVDWVGRDCNGKRSSNVAGCQVGARLPARDDG
ncbi:hypothetical protein HK102_011349, partial [Quaeritorhiza haematococci]